MDSGIGLLAGRGGGTAAAARRRSRALPGPRGHALGPAHPRGPHRARPRRRRGRRRAPARRPDRRLQHRDRARPARPARPPRTGAARHRHGPGDQTRRGGRRALRDLGHPRHHRQPLPARPHPRTSPRASTVTEVPCRGLADAVEHADEAAIDAAVAAAAALTPAEVTTVVLGCTHYELVAERIRAAVQQARPPAARPARLGRRGGRPDTAQARRAPRPRGARGRHPHRPARAAPRVRCPSPRWPTRRAGCCRRPPPSADRGAHGRPGGAVTLRKPVPAQRNLSSLVGMRDLPRDETPRRPRSGPAARPTASSGCSRSVAAPVMALGIELAVDSAWTSGVAPLAMSVVGCIAAGLLSSSAPSRSCTSP